MSGTLNVIAGAFVAGSTNMRELIFFRFALGASTIIILGAIPLYMNELAPSRMRGDLVELHAVFLHTWLRHSLFWMSFWTSGGLKAW
ncbi:hypothetical protein EDD37DRAFT_654894 [Exophiala viscosa]|uniref:uncharacterized protein n=1 Tax=Exophiala viscosa TaxID=2486360 RepID=UPI002197829E|nr:hypothetical protein EDD37DRAFT_654894 [Exophiala viscosa]